MFPFLFCLSRKPEDAAMWERYADNAYGVCIEFDTRSIMKRFWWKAFMEPVLYTYPTKDHLAYNFYKNYISDKMNEIQFINERNFLSYLRISGYIFKHESFEAEDEFRVVMDNNLHDLKMKIDYKNMKEKIKEVMIVNLEDNDVNTENLINGITIGPRSQQNVENLKLFLKSLKLNKLAENIKKSNCPLK